MSANHTPGEWSIQSGSCITSIVSASTNKAIAVIYRRPLSIAPEDQANAHLISAAPDLLAALESCLDSMERNGPSPIQQGTLSEEQDWTTALIKARAAVSKAKGNLP